MIESLATNHIKTETWNEQECLQGCLNDLIIYQEKLYKHFYPEMMAIVLRYTQDRDDATSIINNAFLRVFKKLNTYKGHGSLFGWIKQIVIHSVSDYFRYKKKSKEIDFATVIDDIPISSEILSKYDYNALLIVLRELPNATKFVINLFIIDGYTHREISKMLGISENTSKWHVAEGRRILSKKINDLI